MLAVKYRYFSSLPTPLRYQQAVRADQLWLITLTMSVVGLFTAVQWQSLFPGRRDYMALGILPIRPRQIFLTKLIALALVLLALTATLTVVPSLLFPAVSMSRWQTNPSLTTHIAVHAATCVLGCAFCFFFLLAVQGILLSILSPTWFERLTNYVQGALITVMLAGIVLSFSNGPPQLTQLLQPEVAKWLPPVWLLGLYQLLLGDPDPYFHELSVRALLGFAAAFAVALLSYLISYGRHRERAMEGTARSADRTPNLGRLLDILLPSPRQQAVILFMVKTLARSSQHRVVLMGYFGMSLALVIAGIAAIPAITKPEKVVIASFVYAHMLMLLFLLAGLRQVFGLPSELKANWTFQVIEKEGREEWLRAVDRFAILPVIFVVIVLPAPLEFALLGWRGLAEAILFIAAYLALYQIFFSGWQKLPFTCSYLPGKTNGFVVVLRVFSVLSVLSLVHRFILACLDTPGLYLFVVALLVTASFMLQRSRRDAWSYTPLLYDEEPEPAIRSLKLGRS